MKTVMRTFLIGIMNRMLRNYGSAGLLRKSLISGIMRYAPGQMFCREFGGVISAYLDDEMSPDERRRFEFHLAACPRCLRQMEEFRIAVLLARSSASAEPPDVPPDLARIIIAAMRSG